MKQSPFVHVYTNCLCGALWEVSTDMGGLDRLLFVLIFIYLFMYFFAASLGFCLSMVDNSLSSEYCVCSYQSDFQTFSGLYQDFQGSDKWIMNSEGNYCRLSFHATHQPLTNLCLTQRQAINNDGITG